ncbi:glycosyltransferase family 4 protein [Natronomonas sp. F2-12]|uniref:Glycosyltransferase family 4 protein n=1 Tax=Natronomonas aquatica TaxID=2841590 RepID=A0A9R1CWM6_9EURY|nr:glycosyltransferase family 4 protein [Natronomonas aquatica]MCQ4334959.1 glycosyltransferase family 4 protein [Natronomonas aquatica]
MADMQVCYVVNSVGETSVPATIASALESNTNVAVDVLAWFSADQFEGDDQLKIYCVNAPDITFGIDRETYRTVRNILKPYDLVQAHHPHSGSFAKVIAYRLGIPSVSREGNTRNGFTRKGRIANGLTNPLSEYVVCNSQAVYNSFTRWEKALLSEEQIRIIPNGVDLNRVQQARDLEWSVRAEYGIDSSTILVGNAAMFTEQKAHDVLIRALAIANERSNQRYELVLAGDGPLQTDIEELAQSKGIEDQIHLLGLLDRDHVYRMMDELDIFVMPSRWEGFANAAVEALGVGNACVFSDIEPFTIPYKDVALFHPVNNLDVLAERIIEFGENSTLRNKFRQRGMELVEIKYSLPSIARQYSELYHEVLASQSA